MSAVEDPVLPANPSPDESLQRSAVATRVEFSPGEAGTYVGLLPDADPGSYTLMVIFDAASYPFNDHCRFVRHREPALPYTFANMEFGDSPPGLRVGPWPGWRGIPDMPGLRVQVGSDVTTGRFQFWGDESYCRHVRAVFTIRLENIHDILLSVDDNRLIPRRGELFAGVGFRINSTGRPAASTVPASNPCLLFTKHDLPLLKTRISTTHQRAWQNVVALLDHWHLPPAKTPESKTVPGPERLSPEDRATIAGLIALLEPTKENVSRATAAYHEFVAATRQDDYEPLRIDTQCGEILFLLCLGYDWLHDLLSQDERHTAREWLSHVADVCWSHLGYERHDYAQAHFLGCGLGLLAFSFLFRTQHPRSEEWIAYCRSALHHVLTMLPDDGFFPHGINLWVYEYGFLLRWIELFRVCDNVDLWQSNPHWEKASRFRGAATSHDGMYGMTFGDPQYRIGGDSWCHYLISSRTGSGEARHLGDRLSELPHDGIDYRHVPPRRRVYEFLYCPPNVRLQQPSTSVRFFHDGGQVFLHGPAGHDTLFTFRSGPPLGYQRYRMGERGAYGHGDPANGGFLLYRGGGCLVSGPGPTYRRDTSLHNTITVDGRGQIGDSTVWLPDFIPPEMIPPSAHMRTDGERVLVSAEFGAAYLRDLGVISCRRVLCVDPSRYVAGVDRIVLDRERSIEWNLHTWGTLSGVGTHTVEICAGGNIATLHLFPASEISYSTGLTEMVPAYPHDGRRDTYLRVARTATRAEFTWCLMLRRDDLPTFARVNETQWCIVFPDERMIYWTGEWILPDAFYETVPVDTDR